MTGRATTDRAAVARCKRCGYVATLQETEERPFHCKCWKGPDWELGTWFSDGIDWHPKATEVGHA